MSYYTMLNMWNKFKDTFTSLDYRLKAIITLALVMLVGASFISKAERLVKFIILAAIIYIAAMMFGIV